MWHPVEERLLVKVRQRYEWTHLCTFARLKKEEVHWPVLSTVNAEVFSLAL